MRIAFIIPQMIVGGAEQYVAVKCDWLNKHGHKTIVISAGGCNIHSLPEETTHYTVKELIIPNYVLSHKLSNETSGKISHILQSEKIDIVEAHNTWPIVSFDSL